MERFRKEVGVGVDMYPEGLISDRDPEGAFAWYLFPVFVFTMVNSGLA
jgi:hypothetical protein